MAISYLGYSLTDGYVHNWLVAGPQTIPTADPEHDDGADLRRQILQAHHMAESGITELPVERGPLSEGTFTIGDWQGDWAYVRCEEDHYVDLSATYPTRHYLRAWAYAQLQTPAGHDAALVLSADGPADIWLNDEHVYHREDSDQDAGGRTEVPVSLQAGRNALLVRFEQVGVGATPHRLALRLVGMPTHQVYVILPTTVDPVDRRNALEQIFYAAHLEQYAYERDEDILVTWDPPMDQWTAQIALVLQTPARRIYAETELDEYADPGGRLGRAFRYPQGFYHVFFRPHLEEYAKLNMRITRRLPLWGLDNNRYADTPHSTLEARRLEALKDAARYDDDVYAELAKMAIGWWSRLEEPVFARAIASVEAHAVGSAHKLLGLLGGVARFGEDARFPEDLKSRIEAAAVAYRYDPDDLTPDVMDVTTESHRLLFHTCEILAGQLYAERTFADSDQTGAWHRTQGEARALSWLKERAAWGFADWDSDVGTAEIVAALIHLVAFAEKDEVWELSAAMMDKVLFTMALNSYNGVFGSTRGRTATGSLFHSQLTATSGLSRLMWGLGAYNDHTIGTVSLALAEEYGFPRLIQDIAVGAPDELWSRERHAPPSTGVAVNKVTYRTPDYMLASAQDYRPGEAGGAEHIWQATLGRAAIVFANHPASASLDDAQVPNFWRGNHVLPRVAQWKDVLIAVHKLPEDDWMGFTHAYFPLHAFDAWELREGWAFAQKGKGYLALTASQDLALVTDGPHTRRELRAPGPHTVWLCHMGRAALDGTFAEFQEKILGLDVAFDDLSVELTTLRDESLAFGWEGDLLRNGEPEPITGFRHYESAYGYAELPAEELIITLAGQAMRLDLS